MNRILKAPELVSWEITNQCNLRCNYCSNDDNFCNLFPFLPTDVCKKIVDILHKAKVLRINIEGGEPFLRNDLLEIIGYLNEKGYIPKIATNGTLITRELAKELANYKILTLQISLDAPNKECYSNIRGSEIHFDRILESIEYLKEFKIPICLSMVLMKANINLVEDFIIFSKKIRVNSIRFIDFIPNSEEKIFLVPSSEEIKKAYITINKFENNSEFKIIKPFKLFSTLISDQKNEINFSNLTLLQWINREKKVICEAANIIAHIKANGDITPCVFFREKEFVAGNILQNDFLSIWNHSPVFNLFRELSNDNCPSCVHFSTCMGGCRALAFYVNKNLYGIDSRCWHKLI